MSEALTPARLGGYRLLREVGRGASGTVYEAVDDAGCAAAVKLLAPPAALPEEEQLAIRRRFEREARALEAVRHPNVVRVLAWGEDAGRLYLAMELLRGENLRAVLQRSGPLPPHLVVGLGAQLCAALAAAHRAGVVHRDVKPENLVLLPDGSLRLTDFGVAWMESGAEATLTRTGGVLGSPAYMAPEQLLGRPVDARADLFSAATTLYQLLTDCLPFAGTALVEVAHKVAYEPHTPLPATVPPALAAVLDRALSKAPGARFADATEFAAALDGALAAPAPAARATTALPAPPPLPQPAAAPCPAPGPWRPCARHPRSPATAGCAACGRPMCALCARGEREPYYCYIHQPVVICGINAVRLEVAVAALAFVLLLLCLSPVGYAALHR